MILDKVHEIGCPEDELRMLRSYFRERWVCMCNIIEKVKKVIEKGCLQGSVGGATL